MNIIRARKIFYLFSGVLFALSIGSVLVRGVNLGADFTGDAIVELKVADQSRIQSLPDDARTAGFDGVRIDRISGDTVTLRSRYLSQEEYSKLIEGLKKNNQIEEKSFTSTGPSVGRELRRNAILSIVVALIMIVCYIAWAFREVSQPISSWIYGLIAIIALFHDIAVPVGIFSYLQIQVDALFLTAMLTVLGFSVHDTIVVFDRVREHLRREGAKDFEALVGRSISETITRSINTSLTTVLSLLAIYFFGGTTTQSLALALIIGIVAGTYSSIFIATTLLVTVARWKRA